MAKDDEHQSEAEHPGPVWTHPYMLYIIGTAALFGILLVAGWWAYHSDIIPHR